VNGRGFGADDRETASGAGRFEGFGAGAGNAGAHVKAAPGPGETGNPASSGSLIGEPFLDAAQVEEQVLAGAQSDEGRRAKAKNGGESFKFIKAVAGVVGDKDRVRDARTGLARSEARDDSGPDHFAGCGRDKGGVARTVDQDQRPAFQMGPLTERQPDSEVGEVKAEEAHRRLLKSGRSIIERLF
jgi:hypothetical protein